MGDLHWQRTRVPTSLEAYFVVICILLGFVPTFFIHPPYSSLVMRLAHRFFLFETSYFLEIGIILDYRSIEWKHVVFGVPDLS